MNISKSDCSFSLKRNSNRKEGERRQKELFKTFFLLIVFQIKFIGKSLLWWMGENDYCKKTAA